MLRGPQLAVLRRAFSASMQGGDDRGWLYWAGIHGLPLPMYRQHHTPLFLAWLRAYLYYFELTLKEYEPAVTLPWWDWTSAWSHQLGLPVHYTAAEAGGQPNPLAGGRSARWPGSRAVQVRPPAPPAIPATRPACLRPRRSASC